MLVEVCGGDGPLPFVELVVHEHVHSDRGQLREQPLYAASGLPHELEAALACLQQRLAGGHAVCRRLHHSGGDLLLERCDAHHEELGQVAAEDGEELDPLQERVRPVPRLFQHPGLERQHAELAVDEQAGVLQVRTGGRAFIRRDHLRRSGLHVGHASPPSVSAGRQAIRPARGRAACGAGHEYATSLVGQGHKYMCAGACRGACPGVNGEAPRTCVGKHARSCDGIRVRRAGEGPYPARATPIGCAARRAPARRGSAGSRAGRRRCDGRSRALPPRRARRRPSHAGRRAGDCPNGGRVACGSRR